MKGFRVFNEKTQVYENAGDFMFSHEGELVKKQVVNGTSVYRFFEDSPMKAEFMSHAEINGQQVYQGDVIQVNDEENAEIQLCEVYQNNGVLCVDYDFGEYEMNAIEWAVEHWECIKCNLTIVGTIHNNTISEALAKEVEL